MPLYETMQQESGSLLDVDVDDVWTELQDLEVLGIVYRTDSRTGTRWWLG